MSTKLEWKAYPAGENGFFRAPVLVWKQDRAVLIDGGFTISDGKAVADDIKAMGKNLETILITQSDPDYYFSLEPINQAFPDAKVLAAPDTLAAIRASVDKSWQLGALNLAQMVRSRLFFQRHLKENPLMLEESD